MSLRIVWREFALLISLVSFGSSQILRLPLPATEAARRFCVRRFTLRTHWGQYWGYVGCDRWCDGAVCRPSSVKARVQPERLGESWKVCNDARVVIGWRYSHLCCVLLMVGDGIVRPETSWCSGWRLTFESCSRAGRVGGPLSVLALMSHRSRHDLATTMPLSSLLNMMHRIRYLMLVICGRCGLCEQLEPWKS